MHTYLLTLNFYAYFFFYLLHAAGTSVIFLIYRDISNAFILILKIMFLISVALWERGQDTDLPSQSIPLNSQLQLKFSNTPPIFYYFQYNRDNTHSLSIPTFPHSLLLPLVNILNYTPLLSWAWNSLGLTCIGLCELGTCLVSSPCLEPYNHQHLVFLLR